MFLISHRGNLNGPNAKDENKPEYIKEALSKDFDVEVDVRNYNNKLYLGHDEPLYEVNESFLLNKKLWCHAKDANALEELKKQAQFISGISKMIIQSLQMVIFGHILVFHYWKIVYA